MNVKSGKNLCYLRWLDLCVRSASRLLVAQLFAVALISLETADRMKCFIKIDPIYSRDMFVLGTDRNSMSLVIHFSSAVRPMFLRPKDS